MREKKNNKGEEKKRNEKKKKKESKTKGEKGKDRRFTSSALFVFLVIKERNHVVSKMFLEISVWISLVD